MIESLEQEIRTLRSVFWSGRDPEGRAFAPLADAYRRAGSFRQAVELLTDGLDRLPDFATGHLVAGRLFHEKGLGQEAELAFRRVLDLDGDNVLALEFLSAALETRGAGGEAEVLRGRLEDLLPQGEVAAPAAPEAEAGMVVDIADLAPDEEPVPTWAADEAAAPALAAAEADAGVVVDIADLAPDEEPVPAWAADEAAAPALATAEADAGVVVDIADLAPDEEPEPTWAADEASAPPEATAEADVGVVVDIADVAPDEEPSPTPSWPEEVGVVAVEEVDQVAEEVVEAVGVLPDPMETEPIPQVSDLGESERPVDDDLPSDEIDTEPMVTRTMAELFAAQGLKDRALAVFQQLLELTPADAGLRRRVAELTAAPGAGDMGVEADEVPTDGEDISDHAWDAEAQTGRHDVDTPFAWTDPEPEADVVSGPPISSYFRSMLAWGSPAEAEDESDHGGEAPADDGPASGTTTDEP